MKLLGSTNTLDVVSNNVSKKIGVDFTGKICQILSSSLYTYKEDAVIRELVCNAVDAYLVDCKDKRYDLHLPSRMNPVFYVRDYATGLSPEDVDNVYAHFGRSTKEHSNDFVGCLGIGSKSPFSYVNNFIVISYYQGVQYSYNIFKNALGEPEYIKMNEVATSEPNGLKVQFAVKDYECWKFINAASNIIRFFKDKPTILNCDVEIPEIKYEHKFKYFGLTANNIYHHDQSRLIIMGNIAYGLKQFMGMLDKEDKEEFEIYDFLKCSENIIFFAPIGLFDFSPSRENISLDPHSFKNIKQFMLDSLVDLKKALIIELNSLDNEKTYWEALLKFNHYSLFRDYAKSEFTGKYYKNDKNFPFVQVFKLPRHMQSYYILEKKKPVMKTSFVTNLDLCNFSNKSLFVYVDNKTSYFKIRIKKLLRKNKGKTVYVVYDKDYKHKKASLYSDVCYFNEEDLKSTFRLTKNDIFHLIDFEIETEKKTSSYKNTPRQYIKGCECRGVYYDIKNDTYFHSTVLDLNSNKNIYYFSRPLKYDRQERNNINIRYLEIATEGKAISKILGLKKDGIIFIPLLSSSLSKLEKNKNCKFIFDNIKLNLGIEDYYLYNLDIFSNYGEKFINLWSQIGMINNHHKYIKLKEIYNNYFHAYQIVFGPKHIISIENATIYMIKDIHVEFCKKNISAVQNTQEETGVEDTYNKHYLKLYSYYYKHNDKDIAKPVEEMIDRVYDNYMNKFKNYACIWR